jgi:hypothetical protein
MAGAFAVKLPEELDVVQRHRQLSERFILRIDGLHSAQVQHRVKQHRRVANREHEAVAVGPDRMAGVEAQDAVPQTIHHADAQEIVAYSRGPYCVRSYEAVAALRARGFKVRQLVRAYSYSGAAASIP